MAQDKKVEQITNMEDNFAQWYTDVCRKAELVEYSSVKGFMILRPYGYAIWKTNRKCSIRKSAIQKMNRLI